MEKLYIQNGHILYILNVLKKYSDVDHKLSAVEIQEKVKEMYDVNIDPRTIKRNIRVLKEKFDYDISTWEENRKGYYISKNPETDFEQGEIRAIIDTFSYANYIVPSIAKNVIKKCKNMQNIYENKKLENYKIYTKDSKTENMEVIKNIEDIAEAIQNKEKIKFEYWKYEIGNKLEKKIVSTPIVSPYAITYNSQEFYLTGIKDGIEDFYHFRLDRMKNIEILKEKITIKRTEKQIKEFEESTVEMFGGKKEEVQAVVNKELIDAVIDNFGKKIMIEKIDNDENNFLLKLDVNKMGFKMWAMRNIDMVEVKKPESLRNEMRNIIEKAQKRYN